MNHAGTTMNENPTDAGHGTHHLKEHLDHSFYNPDEDDDESEHHGKQEVQVVVEINSYSRNPSDKRYSEEIDDNSISKSLDESVSIVSSNQSSAAGHPLTREGSTKKTKIVAKVKPNPRKSITNADTCVTVTTPTTTTATEKSRPPAKSSPSSKAPKSPSIASSPTTIVPPPTSSSINTSKSLSPITIVPSATEAHPTLNLGATSPIFESGVNTECIQLLRQLWSLHEELVDFNQQLLLALSKCQQSVQSSLDLDTFDASSSTSGKTYKVSTSNVPGSSVATASSSRAASPHAGRPNSEAGAGETKGDSNHEIRQLIECPAVDNFIQGLKSLADSVNDIERQYNLISICQSQCKLVLYAKVRHAKKYVFHDRFSILYTVHRLILTMTQLLASTAFWDLHSSESIFAHLTSIFQLTEVYNACLESTYESSIYAFNLNTTQQQQILLDKFQHNYHEIVLSPSGTKPPLIGPETTAQSPVQDTSTTASSNSSKNKVSILVQILEAGKNDSPSCRLSLKPLSATKLLQIFAQKRASLASYAFVHAIQSSFLPLGAGAHRLNTPVSKLIEEMQQRQPIFSSEKFDAIFLDEDARLSPFAKCFSKCPSLLGRAAVKQLENGKERLSGSVKSKMYNYFRQVLWVLVGETAEDLLIWDYVTGIPLAHHSLEVFSFFRSCLLICKRLAERNPTPIISTFDSISNSLNSLVLLLSWDEKIRSGFEMASKVKRPEQISLVRSPKEGEWATGVGAKFGDIITTCLTLMEAGADGNLQLRKATKSETKKSSAQMTAGNTINIDSTTSSASSSFSSGGGGGNVHEDEPLCDEAQILFRIDATLAYYKAWVVKRCKTWLNSWAMPAFLACSQRDSALLVQLIKSHQTMFITRQIFLTSPNVSIRLSANHRKTCADNLQETLTKFQKMPDDLLLSSGPVCRMLSLATIQSYMPNPLHWRGVGPNSGLNPDVASPYVRTIISKVIEPVTLASVEFVSPAVQEAIGKQVVQATCEAWLQYILQKKIKFSEWGALQLLRDFMTLRDWIRNESLLDEEARKALLQLEILKRCEGVAFLLLRNHGDVLGVGKPSRSTRRVAPTTTAIGTRTRSTSTASNQSSPSSVSENSVAEDDIPPEMYVPNQQIWLGLRLRRNILSPCCN